MILTIDDVPSDFFGELIVYDKDGFAIGLVQSVNTETKKAIKYDLEEFKQGNKVEQTVDYAELSATVVMGYDLPKYLVEAVDSVERFDPPNLHDDR